MLRAKTQTARHSWLIPLLLTKDLFWACVDTRSQWLPPSLLQHRAVTVCIEMALTEYILKWDDYNTAPFFLHTVPVVDLEKDSDSQRANIGLLRDLESLTWAAAMELAGRNSWVPDSAGTVSDGTTVTGDFSVNSAIQQGEIVSLG